MLVYLQNVITRIFNVMKCFKLLLHSSYGKLRHNKKRPETSLRTLNLSRRLPIFTSRFQLTIFGTSELNFCVRNGNRWNLTVIDTDHIYQPSISLSFTLVQLF